MYYFYNNYCSENSWYMRECLILFHLLFINKFIFIEPFSEPKPFFLLINANEIVYSIQYGWLLNNLIQIELDVYLFWIKRTASIMAISNWSILSCWIPILLQSKSKPYKVMLPKWVMTVDLALFIISAVCSIDFPLIWCYVSNILEYLILWELLPFIK